MNVYERQMGEDYGKLHPMIQKRFNFSTDNQVGIVGEGVMDKIWTGNSIALYLLKKLSKRSILFPRKGENIPFEIHNYPYKDELGREAHSLNRVFNFAEGEERFDGTVIYSECRDRIVEYLGLDHSMMFDMELEAVNDGAIKFRSEAQYFLFGRFKLPIPAFLRGDITLLEWYDEAIDRFYLDLKVHSRFLGPLFGFSGWFVVDYLDFNDKELPPRFRPTVVRAQE